MKKYQNFSSENFHFLVMKFLIYLNRHAFVMFVFLHCDSTTTQVCDRERHGLVFVCVDVLRPN